MRRLARALEMHLAGLKEDGLPLPVPNTAGEYIETPRAAQDETFISILITPAYFYLGVVRKTGGRFFYLLLIFSLTFLVYSL